MNNKKKRSSILGNLGWGLLGEFSCLLQYYW